MQKVSRLQQEVKAQDRLAESTAMRQLARKKRDWNQEQERQEREQIRRSQFVQHPQGEHAGIPQAHPAPRILPKLQQAFPDTFEAAASSACNLTPSNLGLHVMPSASVANQVPELAVRGKFMTYLLKSTDLKRYASNC
jgi:hypothetical protein